MKTTFPITILSLFLLLFATSCQKELAKDLTTKQETLSSEAPPIQAARMEKNVQLEQKVRAQPAQSFQQQAMAQSRSSNCDEFVQDNYNRARIRYYHDIESDGIYTITLTGLQADLDLILLNQNRQQIDFSGNYENDTEQIERYLTAGRYYFIVEAYFSNSTTPFQLSIICDRQDSCDYLNAYSTQSISPQSTDWNRVPGYEDAHISTALGEKALYFEGTATKLIRQFREYHDTNDDDFIEVSWDIYIPSGGSALISFPKFHNERADENLCYLRLRTDGSIMVFRRGAWESSPDTYQQNTWVRVAAAFDLDSEQVRIRVADKNIAEGTTRAQYNSSIENSNSLAGVKMEGYKEASEFYVRWFCVEKNPFRVGAIEVYGTGGEGLGVDTYDIEL